MRSPSSVEVAERLWISARRSLGAGKFTRKRGPNVQGTLCAPELRLEQELVIVDTRFTGNGNSSIWSSKIVGDTGQMVNLERNRTRIGLLRAEPDSCRRSGASGSAFEASWELARKSVERLRGLLRPDDFDRQCKDLGQGQRPSE